VGGHCSCAVPFAAGIGAPAAIMGAQNPAQVFLVVSDKDAFAHGAVSRNSARAGI
jgi:hypothetical protein